MHSSMKQIAIENGYAGLIFACSTENFEIFCDRLFWLTRSEGWRYRSNPLRISGTSPQFGGMMHTNKKQILL